MSGPVNTIELFVKKDKNPMVPFVKAGFYALAGGLFIFLYWAAGVVAFFPLPFFLFGAFICARQYGIANDLEFEYSLSAGVLNIDKIMAQTRRRHVVTVAVRDILAFGRAGDDAAAASEKQAQKILYCGKNDENPDAYYFTCSYEGKGVHMFVFEPDQRMLRSMGAQNAAVLRCIGHCCSSAAGSI